MTFEARAGVDYCVSCAAKRANPRLYSPAELRAAGIGPSVFSEEDDRESAVVGVHPAMAKRIASDEARAKGWSSQ